MRQLVLKRDKGTAFIRIVIGQAQFGTYEVMFEKPGGGWNVIHTGSSTDPVSTLRLGDPDELNGRVLRWDLVMTVLKIPGRYSATVTISQKSGDVVETKPYSGEVASEEDNPAIIPAQRKIVVS